MSDTSEEDKVVTTSQEKSLPVDDPDVKVILLGDSAVGKSKLVERYLENVYTSRQVRFQSQEEQQSF